jgi:hypothetical protein
MTVFKMKRIITGSFLLGAVTTTLLFGLAYYPWYILLGSELFWFALFGSMIWAGKQSIKNKNNKECIK